MSNIGFVAHQENLAYAAREPLRQPSVIAVAVPLTPETRPDAEVREEIRQEKIRLALRRKAFFERVLQRYESGEDTEPTSSYATVAEAIEGTKKIIRNQEQLLQELQKTDSS
jgi:hypothetical protein